MWVLVRRVFLGTSALAAGLLLLFADPFARHWLQNQALPDAEVASALRLLAGVLALRLVIVPNRAFLTGLEDLQWLAGMAIGATIVRSVLVLPVMASGGATLSTFFGWQLLVGLAEWACYAIRTSRRLPTSPTAVEPGSAVFRAHWRFTLGLALTGALWTAATNIDRVILSGLLPLTDFAYFSLAVTAASGVLILTAPLAMTFGPRLTRVFASGDRSETVRVYALQTELTAAMAASASLVLILFPAQLMLAWTGDPLIADRAAPVLAFYAAGNALLAMTALPYQLQVAAGHLRLHVYGIGLFVITYFPLLALGLDQLGMRGAGLAWLVPNLLYLLLFIPLVHRRFLPEPHRRWLLRLVTTVSPVLALGLLMKWLLPWPDGRWPILAQLLAAGAMLLLTAAAGSQGTRAALRDLLARRRSAAA